MYKLVEITETNFAEVINKKEFAIQPETALAYVIQFDKPKDRNQRQQQYLIKQEVASQAPLFVINDEKFWFQERVRAFTLEDFEELFINVVEKLGEKKSRR